MEENLLLEMLTVVNHYEDEMMVSIEMQMHDRESST